MRGYMMALIRNILICTAMAVLAFCPIANAQETIAAYADSGSGLE